MAEKRNTSISSVISAGGVCSGSLKIDGGLRVNGMVEGEVQVTEMLTVGTEGIIKGNVVADSVVVGGRIEGTVKAENQLELHTGSRIEGDIYTRSLIVEEGVFFEGMCRMTKDESVN